MIYYLKQKHAHQFLKVHNRNGVIKMKKKSDETNDGTWITINNPDDLHKHLGNELNVKELNNGLHTLRANHKILEHLPIQDIVNIDEEYVITEFEP